MTFRLGEWTINPESGRVRSGEKETVLQPQVMQLLVYFAEHPREVISLDQMIESVWSGKPMTSSSVYNALNAIRSALGDDTRNPRYLETIPRRGYRLIAEVAESPESPTTTSTRNYVSAAALLMLAIGLLLLGINRPWQAQQQDQAHNPVPGANVIHERSIAVLPFSDFSPEKDYQYFADGMAEEILNVLAGHAELKVVGRTSSFLFRDSDLDLRDIGRQLSVSYLLEGSIQRHENQLKVTAQLISAADGFHVWSQSFTGEASRAFEIQHEIAGAIATKLDASLGTADTHSATNPRSTPVGLEAMDLYMLARQRVILGSRPDVEQAVTYLEQALAAEPDFARAHAELAYALWEARAHAMIDEPARAQQFQDRMMASLDRALTLDTHLADALAFRAQMDYVNAWNGVNVAENSVKAEHNFRKALASNPNHARAQLWYSGLKRLQGRPWRESVNLARAAVELEPMYAFALQHFLFLTSGIPEYRQEQWSRFRQFAANDLVSAETVNRSETSLLFWDGDLAQVIMKSEDIAPDTNVLYYAVMANFFIGEFETAFQWVEGRSALLREAEPLRILIDSETHIGQPRCQFPPRHLGNTGDLNQCSHALLIAGQFERAWQLLEAQLPEGREAILSQYSHTFGSPENVALTLATLHQKAGDTQEAMFWIEQIREYLQAVTEGGLLRADWASLMNAYLNALEGNRILAIPDLSNAIEMGARDFRIFMHPALMDLRDDPGYRQVLRGWLERINREREQLGLDRLSISGHTGPGVIPFVSRN